MIAGYGHIGRRHAEEVLRHADTELVAVIDPSAEARAKASAIAPVFEDWQSFLVSGIAADVLCVCTPNGAHIPTACQGVEVGMHVLVEKPMGLSAESCEELLRLAERKGKEVFCVLQNRYSPPARLLKELAEQGKLGHIYWAEVNCYWNRDERYYLPGSWRGTADMDGGPLYTQFSHFVDLLYWLLGPLQADAAAFRNANHPAQEGMEDTGWFSFRSAAGAAGLFTYSTALWDKNLESSITLIGEKGTVKAGGQYMDRIEAFHVEGMELPELAPAMPPNNYGAYQGSAANHIFVIDNLVKALRGEAYEMAGPLEALASVALIESVYTRREEGLVSGRPVLLNSK